MTEDVQRTGVLAAGSIGVGAIAALAALSGVFFGAVGYTAHYAKATSYLSDDPAACVNCHIMNEQYAGWAHGPHARRATCNDCHVPQDSVVSKYLVKAEHGYRHSKGFTFNDFHEPIRITEGSLGVVNSNCVRCHEGMTHEVRFAGGDSTAELGSEPFRPLAGCVHCHSGVAHGPRR